MTAVFALLVLTFTTVGAVVASRRPENPIGWIFCVGGLVLSVAVSATNYAEYALEANTGSLPGVQYAAWIASWAPIPTLLLTATMLFLLFPDGKLSSRDWGFVAWVAVIASAMVALGDALGRDNVGTDLGSIANPVVVGGTVGNIVDVLGGFGFVLLTLCFVASVAGPFVRLSQARGQEREQLKWFAYAAAIMVSGLVVILLFGTDRSAPSELMWDLGWLVGILGFAFLPVATAIAILRYRLYDIDRIINRTLVYAALTALLAAGYFATIMALQGIGSVVFQVPFRALTGQETPLATVAATLAMAALFNPLRRRIQAFIDRSFYRRKYDARTTLEAFSAKLRNETDLDALSNDLVGVVRETMQPAHVSLWLRPDTPRNGKRVG